MAGGKKDGSSDRCYLLKRFGGEPFNWLPTGSIFRKTHLNPTMANLTDIQLLVLDVDGVLTDGTIGLDDRGREIKHYFSRDGLGIRLAQRSGLEVGVITGRGAPSVTLRLQELDIELVIQRSDGKAEALKQITERAGVQPHQAAFIGDDIVDLPAMRTCGYAMAVADATDEVRAAADHITDARGGRGAVREAIEHILKAQNKWDAAVAKYMG
jgi:3-deoxy-D-manno-octulosonate 8-phosphate phosphatase (KDO 8-P phosphatase)